MRIKVGNAWYECKPGQPIMIELTDQDKINLNKMHPKATKYAVFDDDDKLTVKEKYEWMEADNQG